MDNIGLSIFLVIMRGLNEYNTLMFHTSIKEYEGLFRIITSIYIVIVGYKIMMGDYKEKTKQALTSLILIVFLHSIIIEGKYFNSITDTVALTTLDTAAFMATGISDASVYTLFRRLGAITDLATKTMQQLASDQPTSSMFPSWSEIKVFLALSLLATVYLVLNILFTALFCVAFFSIYIMMTIAPLPLFLAAFSETRFIFFAWLKAVFNYMLFPVFVSLAVGLCLYGLETAISAMTTANIERDGVFTKEYFTAFIWAVLAIYMMNKASEYAAALTGGTSSSHAGLTGAAAMVGGAVWGSTGGAAVDRLQQRGADAAIKYSGKAGSYAMNKAGDGATHLYSKMKGVGTAVDRHMNLDKQRG